jgi:small nuclear ribonucleoprotein (snRNP)-like protein
MLPQGLIQNAIGSAIQVELKTGEIIVGTLESTDTWMNLIVKAATHYREGEERAKRIERTYIRGNNVRSLFDFAIVLNKG